MSQLFLTELLLFLAYLIVMVEQVETHLACKSVIKV